MLTEKELQELIKELYPDTCNMDEVLVIPQEKIKKALNNDQEK